jgi:hypothetical protein
LPVGLVVRQWFLAGDWERAVALARAGRAFADALERLEVRAEVTLGGASRAQVRLDGPRLTVCDDLGRLAGIDLEAHRVTHLVRV